MDKKRVITRALNGAIMLVAAAMIFLFAYFRGEGKLIEHEGGKQEIETARATVLCEPPCWERLEALGASSELMEFVRQHAVILATRSVLVCRYDLLWGQQRIRYYWLGDWSGMTDPPHEIVPQPWPPIIYRGRLPIPLSAIEAVSFSCPKDYDPLPEFPREPIYGYYPDPPDRRAPGSSH